MLAGLTKAKTVKFLPGRTIFIASIERITDAQPKEITIETYMY